MANVIVVIILILVLGMAVRYIVKSKKNGAKCIGCPYCDSCSGKCEDGDDSFLKRNNKK